MKTFTNIDPECALRWQVVPGDWRRSHVRQEYNLLWDSGRAYGQLWPRPTQDEVVGFYQLEEYYTHGTFASASGSKVPLAQRLLTKISWLADNGEEPDTDWWKQTLGAKALRILEVGCGNGSNLTVLASLGHTVVGVEPDPAAMEVARSAGHQVHEGTAEFLPDAILRDRFDVVIFMHVLEHCIDPGCAAANAVKLLNNEGLVIAEVPNNECLGSQYFGPLWHWLDVPRHLNFFTTGSLKDLFNTIGLKVQRVSHQGYCRQFLPEWKNTQRQIAETFNMAHDPRVNDRAYWAYLARTVLARRERKFDSVRLVGRLQAMQPV